ncbi:hypothetical protein WMY93_015046 [Mugilogobius chulae]|uniref:Uncharacterized protein n=1 Tax=Mugilogobius chulae TaxID=88201 RepID=A0AAW0P8Y6_9GOBI
MSSLDSLPSDRFLCSICSNIFTDPVTTPCGHSFCKSCLNHQWDQSEFCQCPTCKKRFHARPEISTNSVLEEVSVQLKRRKLEIPEVVDGLQPIDCDVCRGTALRAVKSCLVCQASYCSEHLESHLRVPGLKRHKLIKPVDNIEERICPIHDKVLDFYCRDDRVCICNICHDTEHKDHKVVSLEEEGAQQKGNIDSLMERIQMMIEERMHRIQAFTDSSVIRKEKAQKEIQSMDAVMDEFMSNMKKAKSKVKTSVLEKVQMCEERDESLVKDLQEDITKLQQRQSELQELKQSEDPLHLLQSLNSVSELKRWTEPVTFPDVCLETVRLAVSKLLQKFQSILKILTKEEITKMKQYKGGTDVDIILGKTIRSANSAQLADTAQYSTGEATGSTSSIPVFPGQFQRNITGSNKGKTQSSHQQHSVQSNPWIEVGPRKGRAPRSTTLQREAWTAQHRQSLGSLHESAREVLGQSTPSAALCRLGGPPRLRGLPGSAWTGASSAPSLVSRDMPPATQRRKASRISPRCPPPRSQDRPCSSWILHGSTLFHWRGHRINVLGSQCPRPVSEERNWLQQGARPKAPISSTPVQSNPWIEVGPRKGRGKRASRSYSTVDLTLGNKFNILDHDEFPPPSKKTRAGNLHFTPAPRSDHPVARGLDGTTPPVLGSLHESARELLGQSTPSAAPVPPGGSSSSARGSPAPRGRGASSAPSLCEQGHASGHPATQSQPHISAMPPASKPGPSVLVLGSSMVRHVRINTGHTSCHPVSSVSSEEPLHQELWSAVAAGLWLMGPGACFVNGLLARGVRSETRQKEKEENQRRHRLLTLPELCELMSQHSLCCICLENFSGPVTLPCGHVFCLSCIGDFWRLQGQCLCPLCKTCFQTRPQLQILESSECEQEESDKNLPPLRCGEVPCDLCSTPRPAVKSCVTCLSSYCPLHLQPHYQDAELGRHLLVNVVKNLEGPLCKAHGRRLERFCRTDQTCICALCAQSDHRGHHTISVKREAAKKKSQLLRKRTKVAQTMQDRRRRMEELLKLNTDILNKEQILELEEEVCELQTRQEQMDQLLQTEDSLHFIQRFLLTAPL